MEDRLRDLVKAAQEELMTPVVQIWDGYGMDMGGILAIPIALLTAIVRRG